MSRKIRIPIGPRSPDDDERILRYILRVAKPGDDIELVPVPATPEEPRCSNEPLERTLAEDLDSSLGQENEKLDADAAAKAVSADSSEPAAEQSAQKRAQEIVEAKKSLSKWREMLNQAGWKVSVEAILHTAWKNRLEIWDAMKEFATS
jgi:hypothetical protein